MLRRQLVKELVEESEEKLEESEEELEKRYNDDEINRKIIEERNQEMSKLAEEMESLHDITRTLSGMIELQREPLEEAANYTENSEINIIEATKSLNNAVQLSSINNIRSFLLKGTLVSTGVLGIGAGVLFLNPIAGIVIGTLGIGGVTVCAVNYFKQK